MQTDRRRRWEIVWALGLIALILASRARFLAAWPVNFDTDEALVGVTARELAQGRWHLYLPGQSYMGTLQAALAVPFSLADHPNLLRIVPMLGALLGLWALFRLDAAGQRRFAGSARWNLCAIWLLPPVVLFFAQSKVRGGNFEAIVLGLTAIALSHPGRRPRPLEIFVAGALLGLAGWSHPAAFLLLPPVLASLIATPEARRAAPLAAVAFGILHLPLWVPRLLPDLLQSPGVSGIGYFPRLSGFVSPELPVRVRQLLCGATCADIPWNSAAAVPVWSLLGFVFASVAWFVRSELRAWRAAAHPTRVWRERPLETTVLWLALAHGLLFIATPEPAHDQEWFRYTLESTPLLVVAMAAFLGSLPPRLGQTARVLVVVATLASYPQASSGWATSRSAHRLQLVRELEQLGATSVEADWTEAFFIRYLSEDRIVCAAHTPVRFPGMNMDAAVDSTLLFVAAREGRRVRPGVTRTQWLGSPSLQEHFLVCTGPPRFPRAFRETWRGCRDRRVLYAHHEPYPLLDEGAFPRDVYAWPPRRTLARFEVIVWDLRQCDLDVPTLQAIERRLEQLINDGRFREVAHHDGARILFAGY